MRTVRCAAIASNPLRDPARHRRQRLGQPRRVGAAGHCQNGLAAALATDLGGDEIDQFAGLDAAGAVKAGELVNFVAAQVGGKGGGKPDLAMAGGTDPSGLAKALAAVPGWVAERV